MRLSIVIAGLATALTLPLAHSHAESQSGHDRMNQQHGSGPMNRMGHQSFDDMQQTMRQMHRSDNSSEQRQLMQEHMRQMQGAMNNQRQMPMMRRHQDSSSQNTSSNDKRLKKLQRQVERNQAIMKQMLEQMRAQHSSGDEPADP